MTHSNLVEEQSPIEQGPSWRRTAARWWHVMRYHHPSQLTMRVIGTLHTRMARMFWYHCLQRSSAELPSLRNHAGVASVSHRKLSGHSGEESGGNAQLTIQGRYCFLNQEIALSRPIDWRLERRPEASHLWRFHLHYHEFLLDLAREGLRSGESQWCGHAWATVVDWIDHNRLDDRRVLQDAWHPYCISRRLPVWIHLWCASPPDMAIRNRVLVSMLQQVCYLDAHLEWDLRGNHLLENLRALVLMGTFFDGPRAERWLRRAAKLLSRELATQILPYGEHFERSPMYHLEVLEALLEIRDAVAGLLPELSDCCGHAASRMAEFLRAIVHPDGQIPLLGDSSLRSESVIRQLLEWAESGLVLHAKERNETEQATGQARTLGGYWIHRHSDDFLLFDAGPVGADHLPAHAHADLLTLEASLQGRRLLVDSGVFGYEDEPMRRYCRSTSAHNVLQIDHVDQCDLWSRFRMGYRGWPSPLVTGEQAGFAWAGACHDAYRRVGVPRTSRWLACRPGGPWLCVDEAQGRGQHRLASWLHFHPDVTVELVGDEVHLLLEGKRFRLQWLVQGEVTLTEGWYCPGMGQRQRAPVVRWEQSRSLPATCGWYLMWGDSQGTAALEQDSRGEPILRWIEEERSVEFRPRCRP